MSDNESEDTLNVADLDPRTTPLYKTSPERIGLAIGCRGVDLWQTDFNGCKDVTWYTGEPPVSVTIGYVRADLYDALQSQLAAANERADAAVKALEDAQVPVCGMCERPFNDREICQVCVTGIDPVEPVASVPEGFVLVPREPTREMIAAGCAANDGIVSDIYRAMVSQVVKESFTTAVPRVPFSMPDAAVERIYDAAHRSFRRFKSGVRGQIVTQADGYEWHVINATLDEVRAMLAASPAAPVAPATVAVPDEENVAEDAYHQCCELIEPFVAREGRTGGTLPASLVGAVETLVERHATQPQAAQAVPIDAVALAYGILWHANNMRPGYDAPAGHERLTPEKAAYKARHVLRDLLTRDQLGDGINRASDMLAASQREGGG